MSAQDVPFRKAEFITSLVRYGNYPGIGLPEVAVAGRSNVGKSSLINRLCGRQALAHTSGNPGKTRLLNLYQVEDSDLAFILVDLPGYGFAQVNHQEKARWADMMEGYFADSGLLCHALHLVDIRHEPTGEDLGMARFLQDASLPYTTVATKADKVSRADRPRRLQAIGRSLFVQPWDILAFSAQDATGADVLRERLKAALAPPAN
jgi:GTP-binding protein